MAVYPIRDQDSGGMGVVSSNEGRNAQDLAQNTRKMSAAFQRYDQLIH